MNFTEQIVPLYQLRRNQMSPMIGRMERVREQYNGDVVIPLPELDRAEMAAVANLVAMGLDQHAMRVASTMPSVWYPPRKAGNKEEEAFAHIRRRANVGWWNQNLMSLKLRRRARYLLGYATAPVIIRPDHDRSIPKWQTRNPLTSYPAFKSDPDSPLVDDCIFAYVRTLAWLQANYPAQTSLLYKGNDPKPESRFDVLEYVDGEEIVLGVVGADRPAEYMSAEINGVPSIELERVPNRAGVCTAVVPGLITLDRLQGRYDGMLGMYLQQAKLQALAVIAAQRGVFPPTWLVSRPGDSGIPKIVEEADPLRGITGIVSGGDLKELAVNPGFMTSPMMDRLERDQRITGGIPAEFGGESTTNVRTGRRGDSVLSAVVDFPIQEEQEILERSLEAENRVAIAISKGYWKSKTISVYVYGKGEKQAPITYVPAKHFNTDENIVAYSHAGADANSLVIGGGQRVGMGTLSKRGFMELDPLVDDPLIEHNRVISEGLEQAQLASLEQAATSGSLPPHDLARITELVMAGASTLYEAVQQAQKEAQARQSTTENPAEPGSPETQPGLAAPGAGAEAGAEIAPPPASLGNLSDLLKGLRRPTAQSGPERNAQAAGVAAGAPPNAMAA